MYEGELTLPRGVGILVGGYLGYKTAKTIYEDETDIRVMESEGPATLAMTGFMAFSGFLIADFITGNY